MQARGAAGRLGWAQARPDLSILRQAALFALVLAAAAALVTSGTMMVPIHAAVLPQAERGRYALVAVAALLFVAACAAAVAVRVRSTWHRQAADAAALRPRTTVVDAAVRTTGKGRLSWRLAPLAVLRPELVPTRVIVATAAVSLGLDIATWLMGFPPWLVVSMTLAPWIPLLFIEGVRKYRHYGLYAVFGAIALLQVGHLGEHTVQVIQVFAFSGDLSRAHGLFGQLDFETVHFAWDSLVWIGLVALLLRFGRDNPWLIVSFAAASLHEVEHIYLFYVYRFDPAFYFSGGFAGIMGSGGLVGSPLARPYLHFVYNVLVIVPLLFAFWRQTVQVFRASAR